MITLIGVALCFVAAVYEYVRPEAQSTAFVLIGIGVALGVYLKGLTGSVW